MTNEQWARLQGQTVFDSAGQKVGEVQRVFYDPGTKQPSWITVRGGRFGSQESFVPLTGSRVGSGGLAVAVDRDVIQHAPLVDADAEMSVEDAARLNRYYEGTPLNTPSAEPTPTETGQPAQLTSFEEQLRVGTETVENGTVRLHKHVVTEPVETTVPLHHEEVSIERSAPDETRPAAGHTFDDEVVEVTLKAERPTIAKEPVPVETVRMTTRTETNEHKVRDEVRRERIEVEDERVNDDAGLR